MKETIEVQIISLSFETYMKYPLSQPCLEASTGYIFFSKTFITNTMRLPYRKSIGEENEVCE